MKFAPMLVVVLMAACSAARELPNPPADAVVSRHEDRPWTMRDPFPANSGDVKDDGPVRAPPGPFCCDGCEFVDVIGLRCNACVPMADEDRCSRDTVDCAENPKSWNPSDRELICRSPTRNSISSSSPLSEGSHVATTKLCEVDSTDSGKGLVISLGDVLDVVDHPADITFQWLADRLHMSPVEIWAALDLPDNEGFVSALYAAKASEWGYEINEIDTPFVSPFGDDYTPPLKIAMPHEPPPHAEALSWLDDGQNSQPDWFYSWPLPRAELWLPKDTATTTYTSPIDADDCGQLDAILRGAENRSLGQHLDHAPRRDAR